MSDKKTLLNDQQRPITFPVKLLQNISHKDLKKNLVIYIECFLLSAS